MLLDGFIYSIKILFFMPKISHEKWKIYGNVFDNYTRRLLYRLSSQGHFDELLSPVSIGKEANIFTAKTKTGNLIIVKIYRLESCNFNKMYDYIRTDRRFESLKKQRRKIIFAWVTREYQNILKAREAGIKVPTPLTVKDHVLLLEMIGDKTPAPKLKDAVLKNERDFANKLIKTMKKLCSNGLVHGDLSEYNILVHNEVPVLIDFSQGTTHKDPNYEEYWHRDIKNISKFLINKIGVDMSEEKIQKEIGLV